MPENTTETEYEIPEHPQEDDAKKKKKSLFIVAAAIIGIGIAAAFLL